jgi:anti-sigma regulatory factor (Ser/Thr protein kinase)
MSERSVTSSVSATSDAGQAPGMAAFVRRSPRREAFRSRGSPPDSCGASEGCSMTTDPVRRSLAPDLNAPAAARRALDRFGGQLEEDVIERSALVVTEVVTNSVTHAGLTAAQPIDLNIQMLPACLRIEVTDEGTGGFDPVVTLPYPGQDSGLGFLDGRPTNRPLGRRLHPQHPRVVRIRPRPPLAQRRRHTPRKHRRAAWTASPPMAECRALPLSRGSNTESGDGPTAAWTKSDRGE